MPIYIANKTLAAIERSLYKDQGASFRKWEGRVLPHIGDAYNDKEEDFRSHMGASLIGGDCARAVWYGWRWATKKRFGGRMLRLFNRGHLEEGRFIALLLMIGARVIQQDENGNQFRISGAGGHFGGSGDGKAVNLPDVAPGQTVLLEFKTHGEKSFAKLAGPGWSKYLEDIYAGRQGMFNGEGVKAAKPQHYVQMQVYMQKMGVPVTLYAAVNKNTDEIYMEMVLLDSETADAYLDLSDKLVAMPKPPAKLRGASPGYYKCKMCDHKGVCFGTSAPAKNCRTCEFASPVMNNGEWKCQRDGSILSKEKQLVGCENYCVNKSI